MADKLIGLFSDVLSVPANGLNDDSSPDTVDTWDSLSAMHLVTAIEATFSVQLSTREIMRMSSIGLARSALREKGVDV
ncbi:MAG: acyl carrier protein [Gammaproteobacteria bacterium]|nr:acyl carrier protein [Gammaproteobacteria bacterium]